MCGGGKATRSIWNKRGGPLMFAAPQQTAVAVTRCMMGALSCSWCRWSENDPELSENVAQEGSKHTPLPPAAAEPVRTGPGALLQLTCSGSCPETLTLAEANAAGREYRTQFQTWVQNFLIQPGTPEPCSDSIHPDPVYLRGQSGLWDVCLC